MYNTHDVSYAWQQSTDGTTWSLISGATAETYTATNADVGKYIRLRVRSLGTGNVASGNWYSNAIDPIVLLGDADQNGSVNSSDATAVLKHCVQTEPLTGNGLFAADVDRNGTVNSQDATYILQYATQIISSFWEI
jgi:hypothetical protein